jgi:hypothetical protein
MTVEEETCHGHNTCLSEGSVPLPFKKLHKVVWRLKAAYIHLLWHLKTKGFASTLKLVASKIFGTQQHCQAASVANNGTTGYEEVLNLKPGEFVEVKSEQEIAATLDTSRRHKGLLWMVNMRKYCGKRYRVFRRLDTILLECSGEVRKIKNTVLLEGVYCDGLEFSGCGRSCLHFWREAWLKRVNEE